MHWLRESAGQFRPDENVIVTSTGRELTYDGLVVAPGPQLDFAKVPGLTDALATAPVSSNYRADLAPRTWELIRSLRSGTAVFTQPSGPIKCAGAPQKIAYLAADYRRKQGVLSDIRIVLVPPDPVTFKVPIWAAKLERWPIATASRCTAPASSSPSMARSAWSTSSTTLPAQRRRCRSTCSTSSRRKASRTRSNPAHSPTRRARSATSRSTSTRCNTSGTAMCSHSATSPTSPPPRPARRSATRPTVITNPNATLNSHDPGARYDGYTSCPLVTAGNKMLLAEFDYDLKPTPTIPLIDTTKERRDMWLLKRFAYPRSTGTACSAGWSEARQPRRTGRAGPRRHAGGLPRGSVDRIV